MSTFAEPPDQPALPDDVLRYLSTYRDEDGELPGLPLLRRYAPLVEVMQVQLDELRAQAAESEEMYRKALVAAQDRARRAEQRVDESEKAIKHSQRMSAQVIRMREEYLVEKATNDALRARIAELELQVPALPGEG